MREMTTEDLARVRAAVQFRDRCVAAAVAHHEWVGLPPSDHYARATFDAIEELIRADERQRVAQQSQDGTGGGTSVRCAAESGPSLPTEGSDTQRGSRGVEDGRR